MKMQVLYWTKTGNAQLVADQVSRVFKCKCDQIPPAYPCDNEKLVLIFFEEKGKNNKQMIAFCKDLTISRAQNVALIALGNGNTDVTGLVDIFKANGVNVVGTKNLTVHSGLFGKGKITNQHIADASDFAKEIAGKIFEKIEY